MRGWWGRQARTLMNCWAEGSWWKWWRSIQCRCWWKWQKGSWLGCWRASNWAFLTTPALPLLYGQRKNSFLINNIQSNAHLACSFLEVFFSQSFEQHYWRLAHLQLICVPFWFELALTVLFLGLCKRSHLELSLVNCLRLPIFFLRRGFLVFVFRFLCFKAVCFEDCTLFVRVFESRRWWWWWWWFYFIILFFDLQTLIFFLGGMPAFKSLHWAQDHFLLLKGASFHVLLPSCQASFFWSFSFYPPLQTSSQKLSLASFFPSSWFNGSAFARLYLQALLLSTRRIISGFNIFGPSLCFKETEFQECYKPCPSLWVYLNCALL